MKSYKMSVEVVKEKLLWEAELRFGRDDVPKLMVVACSDLLRWQEAGSRLQAH
jgi:hypothetical protein